MKPKTYYRHTNEHRVREMRKSYARGEKQEVLAVLYGLTQATVSRIVGRTTWRHVE